MGHHVFISYSRKDQPYARKLADDLRADGVEVWLDDRVDFGDRWWRTIVKAIHACTAFVVVMTPEAEESEWVEREILLAQREGKPLFPLLLRGKGHSLLITTQHADVTGSRMPPKAFYNRLRRTLPAPEPVAGSPSKRPPARKRKAKVPEVEPPVKSPPARQRRSKKSAAKPPPKPDRAVPSLPSTYTNSIGMEFVLIPAGTFEMGSNEGKVGKEPVHTVEITESFYLGEYPVTQAEWGAVMGKNPSYRKGANHPVEGVSWDDAQKFIRKLQEKDGGRRYRMPTEAEWEYACRAGEGNAYERDLDAVAWFDENSGYKTHPVGEKQPNGWGLYDMLGNVHEWVQDWYDKDYYERSPRQDPQGPDAGKKRVLRGGSFFSNVSYVRCAARYRRGPHYRLDFVGFRIFLRPLSVDGRSIDG